MYVNFLIIKMKDCYICGRKDIQYSCILCFNTICNACGETAKSDEKGYDEDNYSVGKYPRGECKKDDNMPSSVVVDKKSFNPFFLPRKRKKGESVKLTSEDVNQNTVQEKPAKLAKYDGHETKKHSPKYSKHPAQFERRPY